MPSRICRDSELMLTIELTRDQWEAILEAIDGGLEQDYSHILEWEHLTNARDAIRLGIGIIQPATPQSE